MGEEGRVQEKKLMWSETTIDWMNMHLKEAK